MASTAVDTVPRRLAASRWVRATAARQLQSNFKDSRGLSTPLSVRRVLMRRTGIAGVRSGRAWALTLALLAVNPDWAGAQLPVPGTPVTYGDGRRAQATRAELEATLEETAKILASPGYSARLREARRREAELIRERLATGDLQVGDQVTLTVLGEARFTGPFLIGPGRVLSLPGVPDIPFTGVLRSEAQDHVQAELGRQLRDPQVQVQTSIRLTVTGAVGRAGYFQVPADMMPTDAIMTLVGGFSGTADPNRTTVRRQGREIWTREGFQDAVLRGLTLDQMNLRTGDEIIIGNKPSSKGQLFLAGLGVVSSVSFLIWRLGNRF